MRSIGRAIAASARRLVRLGERWRSSTIYGVPRCATTERTAAAIAYYGFFATFVLGMLVFAILGGAGGQKDRRDHGRGLHQAEPAPA